MMRHTRGYDEKRFVGRSYGTLYCSRQDVDGEVRFNMEFDDLSPIAKVDLLQDWIGLLEREKAYIVDSDYEGMRG